jgi:hypothetical protein
MEFVIFYDAVDGFLTLIIVNSGGNPVIIQKREFDLRSKKRMPGANNSSPWHFYY